MFLITALLGCGGNKVPQAKGPNPALASGEIQLSAGPLSPADVVKITESSTLWYEVEGNTSAWTDLAWFGEVGPIDPEVLPVDGRSGRAPEYIEPPNHVSSSIAAGHNAFGAGDLDGAIQAYATVTRDAPDYSKAYVWLANSYYGKQDWDMAAQIFERSLEIQPYDYQAHWFLADTYEQQGELSKALDHAIWAYVLNRHHAPVVDALYRIAYENGYTLNLERLVLPFGVETNKRKVTVGLGHPEWLPMGLCWAAFTVEQELRDQLTPEDWTALRVHHECVQVQYTAMDAMVDDGKRLTPRGQLFYDIVDDGYGNAAVDWEIGTGLDPYRVLTLDDALLQQSYAYVRANALVK